MNDVKRFAVPGRYLVAEGKNPGAQDVVLATDYDQLHAANQRLEGEVNRLREALIEVTASLEWNAHGICRGVTEGPIMPSAMAVAFAKAALSTNGEVTE